MSACHLLSGHAVNLDPAGWPGGDGSQVRLDSPRQVEQTWPVCEGHDEPVTRSMTEVALRERIVGFRRIPQ
jgi:hypothetical protein